MTRLDRRETGSERIGDLEGHEISPGSTIMLLCRRRQAQAAIALVAVVAVLTIGSAKPLIAAANNPGGRNRGRN
jgi:hypothetical protein